MKHLFIINPVAGPRDSTRALTQEIQGLNLDTEIVYTTGAGHARAIAERAAVQGEPVRIYACGGDGTLNEVVNGAAGHGQVAITNVPKGTGNDFLKLFGADYRRGFSDLAALSCGPQRTFDLMDCNGVLGIGVVCAGVDARVACDVHRYKRLPLVTGQGAYILSLVVNVLMKGIARPMSVQLGEHGQEPPWNRDTTILCICNGRYYGGGFMPVGDAMPDDGLLDVLLIPKVSLLTFGRLVGEYAKGRYRSYPHLIRYYQGTQLSFHSPQDIVAVVDGEEVQGSSFDVHLSERTVNFFYPATLDYLPPVSCMRQSPG